MKRLLTSYNRIIALIWLAVAMVGCNGDGEPDDNDTVEFDRAAMLSNLADNVIVPAYESYYQAVTDMAEEISALSASADATQMTNARNAYVEAAVAWQSIALFNFGPASSSALLTNGNTYPTDTNAIWNQIESGTFALDAISNTDAIGFPALDYLLYGGSDQAVMNAFSDTANYAAYVAAVAEKLKAEGQSVWDEWKADGEDYAGTFKAATGTDVGSGLGQLVNGLNQYTETHLRDGKVAIPIGIRTLGEILPERAEGYYSRSHSYTFLAEAVNALENLYLGGSGSGLDDHLTGVGASELNQSIQSLINSLQSDIELQTGELVDDVNSYEDGLNQIYTQLQQLTVLLKVDMSSRLGILITYQDNDGD